MTGPTGPAVRAGRDGDGGAARGTPEERLRALGIVDAPGPPDHGDAPDPDADARVRATLAAEPGPRMPPHVLAGIDRALAAERPGTAPGPPERAPGARVVRSFRSRSPLALLAVTLLLVAVVGVIAVAARPGAPAPQAAPPAPAPSGPVATPGGPGPPGSGDPEVARFGRADLPRALRGVLGVGDFGVLTGPGRLTSCLGAHGVPATLRVAGARRVVLDGVPGVLLVLPTGVAARFRLLVVGEDCREGTPSTLGDTVVGL